MKNFSDITAIETANRLEIYVELAEHNSPVYDFTVNGVSVAVTGTYYFDLLTSLHFICAIKSGAVEVAKITINGNEVMPLYQHCSEPATNWITNDWVFEIPGPFYPWYHQITGQGWTA